MPRLDSIDSTPVAWGSHICTFYRSASELQRLVTAYFRAGLEDREACIWVLPPSLTPAEALAALELEIPQIRNTMQIGQLELIPCFDWYMANGRLDAKQIVEAWGQKVAEAASRFAGLRVTGDTSWLQSPQQRKDFIAYERQVSEAAKTINIIALCTYAASAWNSDEMQSVMQSHRTVLLPYQTGWKQVEVCSA